MGRPILCVTTTHPSHGNGGAAATTTSSSSNTLGSSGGSSMTLACPWTGSLLSSLRVAGDLAGKVPIGMHSLSLFPQDFATCTSSNNGSSPQQLALAYGWSSSKGGNSSSNSNKEDAYAMLLTIRRQTASSSGGNGSETTAASSSLPPIVHWKCRIPEANLTAGLLVSTCGLYIVGGGASGSLYVWTAIGGNLICTLPKAHYRSITTLAWLNNTSSSSSSSSRDNHNTTTSLHLVTGGADGMVHVFSLIDLVSSNHNDDAATTIYPLVSWSRHYMPVTAICSLGDRRLVTTSLDGQVLLLDLSTVSSSHVASSSSSSSTCSSINSGTVLATLQLPHGIQSLVMDGTTQTLYAGSVEGTIYIIQWDEYAIYQVQQQQGIQVVRSSPNNNNNKRQRLARSMTDQVFGSANGQIGADSNKVYQTELSGHDRPVTSMALVDGTGGGRSHSNNNSVLLCSGDEGGTLRIWDISSRGCIHMLHPWSSSNTATAAAAASKASSKSTKRQHHPITSIRVVMEETPEAFIDMNASTTIGAATPGFGAVATTASTTRGDKHSTSMVNLVTPLQKFAATNSSQEATLLVRPAQAQAKSLSSAAFWDVARDSSRQRLMERRQRQRRRQQQRQGGRESQQQQAQDDVSTNKSTEEEDMIPMNDSNDNDDANNDEQEDYRAKAEELQAELEKAQTTIKRWEAVNNKLMAQLQK